MITYANGQTCTVGPSLHQDQGRNLPDGHHAPDAYQRAHFHENCASLFRLPQGNDRAKGSCKAAAKISLW